MIDYAKVRKLADSAVKSHKLYNANAPNADLHASLSEGAVLAESILRELHRAESETTQRLPRVET